MDNKKLQHKEVELEKMITPDMAKAMDILAYDFLKAQGYDTAHCEDKTQEGKNARARLTRKLKKDGLELKWCMPTDENKIFCYFKLVKAGVEPEVKVAVSRTLEFVCKVIDLDKGDDKPSE